MGVLNVLRTSGQNTLAGQYSPIHYVLLIVIVLYHLNAVPSISSTSPQIAPQAVAPHLFPLDLLSRNRQLSPQPLESPFTESNEGAIQLLLVRSLHLPDLLDYGCSIRGG